MDDRIYFYIDIAMVGCIIIGFFTTIGYIIKFSKYIYRKCDAIDFEENRFFSQLKNIDDEYELKNYLSKHPEHLFSFIPLYINKNGMTYELQKICILKGMLLKSIINSGYKRSEISVEILKDKFNLKIKARMEAFY